MKVLVACEYRGRVRDAFITCGHDAVSCDLLPSDSDGPHHQGDVAEILHFGWDLMIAHPPCTHLAVSGSRWFKDKVREQAEALVFVQMLLNAPIPRIALENPISIISTRIRKPDQIVQPWMFGHGETKATCLWLKGLPKLSPTNVVEGREPRVHRMSPAQTVGKKEVAPIKASLTLWRNNGGVCDARANTERSCKRSQALYPSYGRNWEGE